MAEDPEASGEEAALDPVSPHVLLRKETHQSLGRRQPYRVQEIIPFSRCAEEPALPNSEASAYRFQASEFAWDSHPSEMRSRSTPSDT
jgi:hypothetical protein